MSNNTMPNSSITNSPRDHGEAQLTPLSTIELHPAGAVKHSIIWLHGLGADAHDFVPMVPQLNLPNELATRFIFPNAPVQAVTVFQGQRVQAWYDILSSSDIRREVDTRGVQASVAAIHTLIAREEARGVASNAIVLAGFSQGGLVASLAAMTYTKPLAGVMALSTYLPESVVPRDCPQRLDLPVFVAHGTQDTVVSPQLGEQLRQLFTQRGFQPAWHSYPMAHSVCPDEVRDIRQWLLGVLR